MRRIRIFNHAVYLHAIGLFLFEGIVHWGAFYVAAYLRFPSVSLAQLDLQVQYLPSQALLFATVLSVLMIALGNYSFDCLRGSLFHTAPRIALVYVTGLLLLGPALYVIPMVSLQLGLLLLAEALAAVVILAGRVVFRTLICGRYVKRKLLVLGTGDRASRLAETLSGDERCRLTAIHGFISIGGDDTSVSQDKIIQPSESLYEYVLHNDVDALLIAADDRRTKLPITDLLQCRLNGVPISDLESFYEVEQKKIRLDLVTPGWLVFSEGFNRNLLNSFGERLLDAVISLIVTLATGPLILIAALAIKIEDGWSAPVFFQQVRVGEGGKPFTIYKLRSMRIDAEQPGEARWAEDDDERITRVGSVLRKYRLDEVPQIFNVLKGDMSLVGPRPERPEFVEELTKKIPYYVERHRVRPGITGWAQIKYPYGASTRDAMEKLQFDLYYVKNHSVFLYILIILLTVEVIFFKKGAR